MDPIKSNSLSKTCGDVMSSNCINWAGPAIQGVCGGDISITQVIQSLINCCQNTNTGVASNSCFAAGWIDIKDDIIPSSTDFNSATVVIGGFQQFFGSASFASIVSSNPMYRFTASGDVQLEGVIDVTYLASAPIGYAYLDMGNVTLSCLTTTMNTAKIVLTEVETRLGPNMQVNSMKAYAILLPTGQLRLLIEHEFVYYPSSYKWAISLGGVNFNL